MPEGPTIYIASKELSPIFKGKKIDAASGHADIDFSLLKGRKIKDIKSWGKHLLIMLPNGTLRIHFLMFGKYTINKKIRKATSLKVQLTFGKKKLYFFTCAVRWLPGKITDHYNWNVDLLSKKWDKAVVRKKVKALKEELVCDALLNQDVFAGSGNIIKNEVLYRARIHPESKIGKLPPRKLTELVTQARQYSFDFLKWKQEYTLAKHWEAYTKKTCKRCKLPFKKAYCGTTKRRTFYCENCQVRFGR